MTTSHNVANVALTSVRHKEFTTLLSLVRPLSSSQALVQLFTPLNDLSQITLSIKEPLELNRLYKAKIEHEDERFLLKEFTLLPKEKSKLLLRPALMTLTALVHELQKGKTPQSVLYETLASSVLQSTSKEESTRLLENIIALINADRHTIVVEEKEGEKGYITFKKPKSRFSQKMLEFNAFFSHLGDLNGIITQNDETIHVRIWVESLTIQELLLSQKKALKLQLKVEVTPKVSPKLAVTSMLDIKA